MSCCKGPVISHMHALTTISAFSSTAVVLYNVQRTSLATHVFRLLRQAAVDRRPVPWLLIENVGGLY